MIGVQLPGSDPALDMAGACVAVGLFGGGIAWLLFAAGRDAAEAGCKEDARLQRLTGQYHDDFVRQCTWQRSD